MIPRDRPFDAYLDSVLYKSMADFATHNGLAMGVPLKRELARFAEIAERRFEESIREINLTPIPKTLGPIVVDPNGRIRPATKDEVRELLDRNATIERG